MVKKNAREEQAKMDLEDEMLWVKRLVSVAPPEEQARMLAKAWKDKWWCLKNKRAKMENRLSRLARWPELHTDEIVALTLVLEKVKGLEKAAFHEKNLAAAEHEKAISEFRAVAERIAYQHDRSAGTLEEPEPDLFGEKREQGCNDANGETS